MDREARNRLLELPDPELRSLCRIECFRGTGRGGQKRNTTDSAVRVTHLETSVSVVCDETRSQTRNRALALRRLRHSLALAHRAPPELPPTFRGKPGPKSPAYPIWMAEVLDVLEHHGLRISDAAAYLGTTTGKLVRDLAKDNALWQHVNASRQRNQPSPLRQR